MMDTVMANKIYDVLVNLGGANPNPGCREDFMKAQIRQKMDEYRFGGAGFGSGSKFHRRGSEWFVTCYPEDSKAPGFEAKLRTLNEALGKLRQEANYD
jgi:hypothetical protein